MAGTDIPALTLSLLLAVCGCASHENQVLADGAGILESRFDEEIDFQDVDYDRLQAACFLTSNKTRVANGVAALKYDPRLEAAAAKYARTMSRENFIAHVYPADPARREPSDRVRDEGVSNPYIAENIALVPGYPVPDGTAVYVRPGGFSIEPNGQMIGPHTYQGIVDAVMTGWMNSPGHRKNLLSKDALQLGCGASLTSQGEMPMMIFVQNFQLYETIAR